MSHDSFTPLEAYPTGKRRADVVLDVEDLETRFFTRTGSVKAVNGVSFNVGKSETLGIVGESGCGKSVTALSVLRLISPRAGRIVRGSIRYGGRDLLALDDETMRGIRGNEISMIFQEPMTALNPVFTVGYQVSESVLLHEPLSRKAAFERAVEMLRLVELMLDLQQKLGTAIVMITHDLGVVAETAQRVVVMYAGRKVEEADVESLFDRPRHPYTRGLIGAIPRLGSSGGSGSRRLHAIEGTVPALGDLPAGCAFAPRCALATDQCRSEAPPMERKAAGHYAACWHSPPDSIT
jgi:oligopeptide/dipeptide ABC transporter ATP-binding protein